MPRPFRCRAPKPVLWPWRSEMPTDVYLPSTQPHRAKYPEVMQGRRFQLGLSAEPPAGGQGVVATVAVVVAGTLSFTR